MKKKVLALNLDALKTYVELYVKLHAFGCLGTRWKWILSSFLGPYNPWGESFRYLSGGRFGWIQKSSEHSS